jgi:hypothetical protein
MSTHAHGKQRLESSIFDLDDAAKNVAERNPSVDVAVIVADLILAVTNGSDEVGEVAAFDAAKDGVADLNIGCALNRRVSAFLAVLDARRHRVAAFAETDGLSGLQARDVRVASDENGKGRGSGERGTGRNGKANWRIDLHLGFVFLHGCYNSFETTE